MKFNSIMSSIKSFNVNNNSQMSIKQFNLQQKAHSAYNWQLWVDIYLLLLCFMNRIVRFNLTADNYADDDGFSSTLLFVNIENGYRKPEPGSFQIFGRRRENATEWKILWSSFAINFISWINVKMCILPDFMKESHPR